MKDTTWAKVLPLQSSGLKHIQVEREMGKAAKGRINARKDGGALAKLSTRGKSGKRREEDDT